MKALGNLQSPRLIALQQHLQNGNNAVLTSLWQELEAQGTPLVEPQENGQYLVTLLWRDEEQHKDGELTCSLVSQSIQFIHYEGSGKKENDISFEKSIKMLRSGRCLN